MAKRALTRREQGFVLLFACSVTALIARWDTIPWERLFPPEPPSFLRYEVRDFDTNALLPCKVTILGVGGTANPYLHSKIPGCNGETAVCSRYRVMSISGTGSVALPKGSYDVYISHGPEWNRVIVRNVQIADQNGAEAVASLRHVVDMTGWISADFHVHGRASWDSDIISRDRLFQAVADDLRFFVAADHNVLTDYEPVVHQFHLEQYVKTVTGQEITPPKNQIGHFTAFPLVMDRKRQDLGAIEVEHRTPTQMMGDAHAKGADVFVIANHPRDAGTFAYFEWGRYDPGSGKARNPEFSFNFDGIEVMNGAYGPSMDELDSVVRDWMSLLSHGRKIPALGDSDSHLLYRNVAGFPRNFIHLKEAAPDKVTARDLVTALRGMHSQLSTGPVVRLSVGDAGIGDLVQTTDGKVHVELTVEAADWISVRTVFVWVNGHPTLTWRVPSTSEPVRMKRSFDLPFDRDGFFAVEVEGNGTLAPVIGGADDYQARPFALTNPIFVDADGDGEWVPAPE